jgi:HlyD family secretion protein
MKTPRKLAFLIVAFAMVGGIVYAFLPKAVPVETAFISRGPLQVTVRDDGRTRIKDRYVVSAPLAGQLQRVEFKPGHPIKEGTVLAVIEPTAPELLDPRTHAAAQARVRAAEETLNQANALLERATASSDYSQNDLKRVRELFDAGTVSDQEMDRALLAARTTEGDLDSARFGVRIAGYELDLARTALERGSPGTVGGKVEISAPVAGKVLRVMQESRSVVAPGTPLMEIGDPRNLEIEIDVLSSDAVKIQPGARVLLEYWGGPQPLDARVRLVEPSGFLKISALGVEEQRVWVIADFVSPQTEWQNLGDAYRVEARIVTWETNATLRVPTGALFREQDHWAVFKVQNKQAQLQRVNIGHRSDHEAEVLDGLVEGESVIVHPSDRVSEGVAVTRRTPRP